MAEIDELRRAKEALRKEYGDRPWFRGVGIGTSKSGLVLRLNVDPDTDLPENEVPQTFLGHPVTVVFIGRYKTR